MKANKFIGAISLTALSFALSGCYPSGDLAESRPNTSSDSFVLSQINGQQQLDTIDNLTVSVELPEEQPSDVVSVELRTRKWDKEAVKELLIGGKTVSATSQTPSDDFPDEFIEVYDTEDGWRLILESGRISYDDKNSIGEYSYDAFFTAVGQLHFENASVELESFSRSDAVKTARDLLDKLDLTYVSEPEVYAITSEVANETLSQLNADHGTNYTLWTKDDEIYILRFALEYENIPMATRSVRILGTDKYSPETSINVVVSSRGIVSLKCKGVFNEEHGKGNAEPIKVDAQTALNSLVSNYSKKVLNPTIISNCQMVYLPVAKNDDVYTCSPFWEFDIMTEYSTEVLHSFEYISTETGIIASNYN